MTPLLDGDVIRYEVGFAAEVGWQGEGLPSFDYVASVLHQRIDAICEKVGATAPPIIFLTGSENFRNDIAKLKPYKGTRKSEKPFHFANITAYMNAVMDVRLREGMEADDMMAVEQTESEEFGPSDAPQTIICSRDKDLRQVPGMLYSWELGGQPSFGPVMIEEEGSIELVRKEGQPAKIMGTGLSFFYSQCLTGDSVDNIPGLPKCGPVKAYELLSGRVGAEDLEKAVCEAYMEHYEDDWEQQLLEQGQLLWMVREFDDDGNPVMWKLGGM